MLPELYLIFLRCCYGDLKIGSQGFSKPLAVGKKAGRTLYCGQGIILPFLMNWEN